MKVAISVPDTVFNAGERLARQLKVSRSELYANALAEYVGVRGAAAVSEKLNAVYALQASSVDPSLSVAQSRALADEAW
jgi:metal-responsive CopG/Arc/MetJ family transcriptional regulator